MTQTINLPQKRRRESKRSQYIVSRQSLLGPIDSIPLRLRCLFLADWSKKRRRVELIGDFAAVGLRDISKWK
jgi:hypothetical protein